MRRIALVALALCGFGFSRQADRPRFDVVSIKPSAAGERPAGLEATGQFQPQHGGYWSTQAALFIRLAAYAFRIPGYRIDGVPDWARGSAYDVEARMPPSTTDAQFRAMLQSMLAERFQMRWHTEMRPTDVSVLTGDTPGPGLHPAAGNCLAPGESAAPAPGKHLCGIVQMVRASGTGIEIAGYSVKLADLAAFFTATTADPVVDESGSTALYDFDVWLPHPQPVPGENGDENAFAMMKAAQAVFRKELGVQLDLTRAVKRPMPVLVVDHLVPAAAN